MSVPGKRWRVLVTEPIHPAGLELLSEMTDVIVGAGGDLPTNLDVATIDALVVRKRPLDRAFLSRATNLKVISKHGAGIDNIDLTAASSLGIVVANAPGTNADAVAEGTVALMLAAARQVVAQHTLVLEHRFDIGATRSFMSLLDGNLGIVGFGSIGSRVAQICRDGLGMHVLACDPSLDERQIAERGATKVSNLDELLSAADVVSLHVPLTPETYHLIDAGRLAVMKRGSILVNTARGGLVDEEALAASLRGGHLSAAALDVFETEPPSRGNPLFRASGAVFSPHAAGRTSVAVRELAIKAAANVIQVARGELPSGIQNFGIWQTCRAIVAQSSGGT